MASELVADILAPSISNDTGDVSATDWMKGKDSILKHAFIFGTHNSCGKDMGISEQIRNGVRFLDLHLATHEGKVWVFHDKPCIELIKALCEIELILGDLGKTEKIILHLRESPNAPKAVKWGDVKKQLKKGTDNFLVAKSHAGIAFSKMIGSIILIAPKKLEMDGNWGEEAIAHFETSEGVPTDEGLSKFLVEDKKIVKPIWVECKSLEDPGTRRDMEVEAVKKYFSLSSGKPNINIVTFSAVDKKHFPDLKEILV